jgi:predicted alpha/beta hydrolase
VVAGVAMRDPSEVDALSLQAADGHAWTLLHRIPEHPRASLLWLPALGVAARHYLPFAEALHTLGIAVFLHEARGHGSSSWRASSSCNWGYRELLELDLPASLQAMRNALEVPHRIVGGHSLGGQLASCLAALAPSPLDALWLVASGTPHWRRFPAPRGLLLPLAYRFMRWLAERNGTLPGRRIGFGGNEARGLIDDWSRVGLSGRYAGHGMQVDLEQALSELSLPVSSVLFTQDWFAPATSLLGLTGKFAAATRPPTILGAEALGAKADHFAWMQHPQRVAEILAAQLR